jgi:transposase
MDIHKKFSKAVMMNKDGKIKGETSINHDQLTNMETFFNNFEKGTDVVMEATFNWPWIADMAEKAELSVNLAHPLRAREMAKGMAKNDRKDAIFLGKLLLAGDLFPRSYFAPKEVRRMRSLFRTRSLLVRMRTATKNNIHGQLFRMGITLDGAVSDKFSIKGRALLENLDIPSYEREMLDRKLAFLDDLSRHISLLEDEIKKDLKHDPRADILMSVPGIGEITAYAFLSEIGELERFPNGRALAAYAGVLPLDNKSADKDYGKRTGGNCNYFLRWSAIEAVSGAVRKSARMKSLHSRVKAKNKKKPGKARVAVARKLMELVYLLLAKGELYNENPEPRPGSRKKSKRNKSESGQPGAPMRPSLR